MTKTMDALISERRDIAMRMDDGGAFPGSKAWLASSRAMNELAAFDAAHPEVHAEIMRRHAERVAVADPFVL